MRERHVRRQGSQPDQAPRREQDADSTADCGEKPGLGEQLPDDARAPGAEREPHRDLAAAHPRPREQERRDVDARHEKHAPNGAEQHHHRAARGGIDPVVAERSRHGAPDVGLVSRAGLVRQAASQYGQLLVGPRERHVPIEPRDDGDEMLRRRQIVAIGELRRHADRQPQHRARGQSAKRVRQDADDGQRHAVDDEVAVLCERDRSEAAAPESFTEDDNRMARRFFVRGEPASR